METEIRQWIWLGARNTNIQSHIEYWVKFKGFIKSKHKLYKYTYKYLNCIGIKVYLNHFCKIKGFELGLDLLDFNNWVFIEIVYL